MIAPMKPNQTIVWTRRLRTRLISSLLSKLLILPCGLRRDGIRSSSRSPLTPPAAHGVLHGAAHELIEIRHLLETRAYALEPGDCGAGVELRGQRFKQAVLLPDHGLVIVSDSVERSLRPKLAMPACQRVAL